MGPDPSHRMMGIALHIVRRRDWAEEVLQEGFVLIWRKAASFEPARGEVLPWMAAVIRYRAIDFLRAQQRKSRTDNAMHNADYEIAASVQPVETNMQLFRCLEKLKENHRNAVLMAFYKGLT